MNQVASPRAATAEGSSVASVRTTRMTPSAPMPARRSHSRRTCCSSSSCRPLASGISTKSFWVPCPLTNAYSTPRFYGELTPSGSRQAPAGHRWPPPRVRRPAAMLSRARESATPAMPSSSSKSIAASGTTIAAQGLERQRDILDQAQLRDEIAEPEHNPVVLQSGPDALPLGHRAQIGAAEGESVAEAGRESTCLKHREPPPAA